MRGNAQRRHVRVPGNALIAAGTLAAVAWLVLTIPVLVAGFIRLPGWDVGRRRNGKSDAIDAVRAARELLARALTNN